MFILRTSNMRAIRGASTNSVRLVTPRLQINLQRTHFVRLNSTEIKPNPRPVRKEKESNPQRDWDAKVIKYDDLKPKTESPAPVGILFTFNQK